MYVAPEMIKKEFYNEKIDIWGVGIIAYEMLAGKYPFLEDYTTK